MREYKTLIILGISYCLLGTFSLVFNVSPYIMNCIGIGSFLLTLGQFVSSIQSLVGMKDKILFDVFTEESKKSEITREIANFYSGEKESKIIEILLGWISYILYGFGIMVLVVLSNLSIENLDNERISFIFTSITIALFFFSMAIESYIQHKLRMMSDILSMKAIIFSLNESSEEFNKKENIDELTKKFYEAMKSIQKNENEFK